jgi:nucleoside-diphosphate-sugar epimerase
MRIAVTGAGGFVGAHLVRALLEAGDEVHAVSRSRRHPRLDEIPGLHRVEADLNSEVGRASIAALKPDVCVHAAWCTAPGKYLTAIENVDLQCATLSLAKLLAERGCRRFLALGTCFEYDTRFGYLSEETPLAPSHLYAAAKAGTFLSLQQLGAVTGMQIVWPRLFHLYGPGECTGRLVPSVVCPLLRGEEAKTTHGGQVRDFLYVEDVASAVGTLVHSDVVGPVNVASGRPVTVESVVREAGRLAGRPDLIRLGAVPYNPADPKFICANTQKLLGATAWKPRWTLSDGLARTVEWWRSNGPHAA